MFNLLINCFVCGSMIFGVGIKSCIQDYLTSSDQVQIIIDNNYSVVTDLTKLNEVLNCVLDNCYQMPALGVSIHTETLKEIKQGVWLKLQYNGTQILDDMTFDELLIEIGPEFGGLNIIRGNYGIYEGRCFYVNNINIKPLYDFINQNYALNPIEKNSNIHVAFLY